MANESQRFEALVQQLALPDVQTQVDAVQSLGALDDPRVIEPLLAILRAVGKVDYRVFRAASDVLAQLAHSQLDALIDALRKEQDHIALEHLVEILGNTRDPRVVEPLFGVDRALFLQRDVFSGEDEDFMLDEINTALREVGPPAVDYLITMLRDPDETVRRAAASDLTVMKDLRAVEPLLNCLHDPSERVRCAVLFAFRLIWDDRAIDPLLALLRDPSLYIRKEAVAALGRIGDRRAVEPLIAALRDSDAWVRDEAVGSLFLIGDDRAIEPLIARLRDRDAGVRIGAISVLGQINDKRAVEPLIARLRDRNAGVRGWAVRTLGFMKDERIAKPLIKTLRDPDESVRDDAAVMLRNQFDAPEIQAILLAYESDEIKPFPRNLFGATDRRQSAVAVMLQKHTDQRRDGEFLAYLSPNRVRSYYGLGLTHRLEAENLHPQHVLACWIWQAGGWQSCPAADFLAQRSQQGTAWTEFALRFTGIRSTVLRLMGIPMIIVWQSFFQVSQHRRGGSGGTIMLKRTPDGWGESDRTSEGWVI